MQREEIIMFGLGVPELVLILIIGLALFGAGKLPEVARALGKSVKEFRNEATDSPREINAADGEKEKKTS